MDWRHLEPRDRATAAHTALLCCLVGAGLSGAFTVLVPQGVTAGYRVAMVVVCVVTVLVGLGAVLLPDPWRRWLWVPVPLVGLLAVVVMDLGTRDASVTGQMFVLLPVLYAASQLRGVAAWGVAAVAVAAEAVVVFSLLPPGTATADLMFVGATVLVCTHLLVRAGDRNEQLLAELTRLAAVDPLTGLVTRRGLDEAVHAGLSHRSDAGGSALLLLDVDRFKTINDTHGHPVGDAALRHIAGLLRGRCRPDTVVSRLGGDELAVLLPDCPVDVALRRAEDLVAAVAGHPLELPSGDLLPMSVSVGLAYDVHVGATLQELYAAADESLYDAKRAGRGRVGAVSAVGDVRGVTSADG
ncbi:GGDEF domain-containing protein [Thalassiella azotivora]